MTVLAQAVWVFVNGIVVQVEVTFGPVLRLFWEKLGQLPLLVYVGPYYRQGFRRSVLTKDLDCSKAADCGCLDTAKHHLSRKDVCRHGLTCWNLLEEVGPFGSFQIHFSNSGRSRAEAGLGCMIVEEVAKGL
jgi:hypothetical protein